MSNPQMNQVRDVFKVLESGNLRALSLVAPPGFNWKSSVCPDKGYTPLQQVIESGLEKARDDESKNSWVSVAAWLLEHGACPIQQASQWAVSLKVSNSRDSEKIKVNAKGRSALSLAVEILDIMEGDRRWIEEEAFLSDVVDLFEKHSPCARTDKIHIDESVVDRWAWMLKDTSHHDVTLSTADGARTAHSAILMRASPVLKAALSSVMVEGQSKSVDVTDTLPAAVSLFLELVYTGSTSSDVSADIAVATLNLAHRWQVEDVVSMMANCVKSLLSPATLSPATFVDIASAAQLLELPSLKQACVAFADSNHGLVAYLASHVDLPPPVLELFGRSSVSSSTSAAPPKKRRTF
eukprot:TRINITY_DN32616_c0_g1_i2.p1 TRINITY_DN32616_c0_g1~~TRINITY_DN32616_c0_g1_i2.p1  ORF type:complete len:352 (-),score=60.90 TRINITY_DN32616_c0_g1_i2:211-1266(-)